MINVLIINCLKYTHIRLINMLFILQPPEDFLMNKKEPGNLNTSFEIKDSKR